MSRILRAPVHGPVTVDIGLVQEIEAFTAIDCEPPPGVIAPLAARADALAGWPPPPTWRQKLYRRYIRPRILDLQYPQRRNGR